MKNFTLFAAALASVSFAANAQTINSSWAPSPGMSQVYHVATLDVNTNLGGAGAGQNWNFSNLMSDSSYTENVVAASEAIGASNFPAASYAVESSDGTTDVAAYFIADANAWSAIGGFASTPLGDILMNYSNAMTILQFPASLNSTFTDDYASEVAALGISRTGTNVSLMDGAGMLTTPAGTFNNVLRQKSIQTYTEFTGIPLPPPAGEGETTVYTWVSSDYPGYALLTISIDITENSNDTTVTYSNPSEVGIANAATESLQISPNPANNLVAVSFPTGANLSRVELLDLSGRIIATENINGKSNRAILSTSTYTSGMYILRAVDTNGASVTSKVMVAH